jgi:hypothetical protein
MDAIFILVDYHPFFLMSGIPVLYKRNRGEWAGIRSYVHLFSDHFRSGKAYEMTLMDMRERLVGGQWVKYQKYLNQPIGFLLAWQKA